MPGSSDGTGRRETEATPEQVTVEPSGSGRFQLRVHAGTATFLADEPLAAGGLGSGPNPYDLLCAALGSCTLMTLRLYADRKAWTLPPVRVEVSHARSGLAGRSHFTKKIMIEACAGDERTVKLLSVAGRCPVHLLLAQGAEVTTVTTYELGGRSHSCTQHAEHVRQACEKSAG